MVGPGEKLDAKKSKPVICEISQLLIIIRRMNSPVIIGLMIIITAAYRAEFC
jgi:hypothetical protein